MVIYHTCIKDKQGPYSIPFFPSILEHQNSELLHHMIFTGQDFVIMIKGQQQSFRSLIWEWDVLKNR